MKLPMSRKKQEEMDMAVAKQMLDNVFDACNYEHNTIPVEVLFSYSNYRRERFSLQNVLLIGMMVLFLLLPLLFISPQIRVEPVEGTTRLKLTVEAALPIPVQSIRASMNGKNVALYESDTHEYILQPTDNGTLTLSVSLLNRQRTTIEYAVSSVDNDAPTLVSSDMDDDYLYLYVADALSGIDPDGLWAATGEDEEEEVPVTWDAEKQCVIVPYPTDVVNVYVSDMSGNCLNLLLTPQ